MQVRRRAHWIICCSAPITIGLFGGALLRAADKAPVPPVDAQDAALALVKDVYGDEHAEAKSSEQKTALVRRLLQAAKGSDRDTANRYALLRVAWDIATDAGDAKLAMQVTEEMVNAYEVDALNARIATVKATAESVRSSTQRTALATVAMDVVDEAVAGDNYGSATELAVIALAAARKAQDWQLVKRIVARDRTVKEMAEAHAKAQAALATLENDPTNAEANQVVGEYCCFAKGDWTKGIPMLALGSDETLRTLAQKDLKGASSPNEQMQIGDGWWEIAPATLGDQREASLMRAGCWYRAAKAGLAPGLMLDKVEKRLEEIDKIDRPKPAPIRSNSVAVSVKEPWPFAMPVKKGQTLHIIATGRWRVLGGGQWHGPNDARFYLQGRLGQGEPFKVGSEFRLDIREAGTLYLGMREGGKYSNNSGEIIAVIRSR